MVEAGNLEVIIGFTSILFTIIAGFVGLATLLLRISNNVKENTKQAAAAAEKAAIAKTQLEGHEKLCNERGEYIKDKVNKIHESLESHIHEEDNNVVILREIRDNLKAPKHFWNR